MPVTLEKIPGQEERVILSMGPQHPSTHGVLRLVLELEGETVVRAKYDIGYLHTGFEKSFESKTYTQGITLTDRMDYLAPLSNNLAFCLAAEKLLDLEIPPKAQWVRVLLTELTRLGSHLVWLGTHAIDIGAMSVFLYCFREREGILRIFEMVSGQRMMTSYFRIGGLPRDPPPAGGHARRAHPSQRAAHRPAGPRQHEELDRGTDLPLQDRDRGLPPARRRSVPVRRVAARRTGDLHGE